MLLGGNRGKSNNKQEKQPKIIVVEIKHKQAATTGAEK